MDEELRLDLRGLKCPLPALKTRAALARLAPRALLVVEATDPMAAIDIPHVVAQTGNELIGQTIDRNVLTFRIRRGDGI
jgi:tRNA 2-thiouridine synthesizing protein A